MSNCFVELLYCLCIERSSSISVVCVDLAMFFWYSSNNPFILALSLYISIILVTIRESPVIIAIGRIDINADFIAVPILLKVPIISLPEFSAFHAASSKACPAAFAAACASIFAVRLTIAIWVKKYLHNLERTEPIKKLTAAFIILFMLLVAPFIRLVIQSIKDLYVDCTEVFLTSIVNALFIRLIDVSRLSVLTLGISLLRASANLGNTSAERSLPSFISLSKLPSEPPAAIAIAFIATGSFSPICKRSSCA